MKIYFKFKIRINQSIYINYIYNLIFNTHGMKLIKLRTNLMTDL